MREWWRIRRLPVLKPTTITIDPVNADLIVASTRLPMHPSINAAFEKPYSDMADHYLHSRYRLRVNRRWRRMIIISTTWDWGSDHVNVIAETYDTYLARHTFDPKEIGAEA